MAETPMFLFISNIHKMYFRNATLNAWIAQHNVTETLPKSTADITQILHENALQIAVSS